MSHIYIIEFSGGLFKVGRTNNPKNRIKAHTSAVRSVSGLQITNQWVSCAHSNHSENELNLIRFCAARFDQNEGSGREWFKGCKFDELVSYAEGLSYFIDSDEKKVIDEEKSKAYLDKIFGSLDDRLNQAKSQLSYECAIKLEGFIRDSLWVGGDIFAVDEKYGYSPFVVMVGAYFYSGNPVEMLIDSVSQILIDDKDQMHTTHDFYMEACSAVAKLWGEK